MFELKLKLFFLFCTERVRVRISVIVVCVPIDRIESHFLSFMTSTGNYENVPRFGTDTATHLSILVRTRIGFSGFYCQCQCTTINFSRGINRIGIQIGHEFWLLVTVLKIKGTFLLVVFHLFIPL